MIARRKKPKKTGAVNSRIKQMYDEAAAKGDEKYQSDLTAAEKQEDEAKRPQKALPQRFFRDKDEVQGVYSENSRRAGVNATPSQDVKTRKSSGMYEGSVPVAGTSDRKFYAKRNPIKGVRNSDAKGSVKRAMIRKMKSGYN